jgi:CDP-diacylglycerol--serine O-phosphatidyltransferase
MCSLLTVVIGLLMVSNIRYHSFKEFDLKNRIPFMAFLIIVPVFVLIAIEPASVLFLLAISYTISGPIFTLILLHRHRAARKDAR